MDFLEKDLEDILFNAPTKLIMERGLACFDYTSIFRQVDLNEYGIADLVTVNVLEQRKINITVYELKNKVLNEAAFWQLTRYMKGIKHALSWFNLKNRLVDIRGRLIGRSIDTSKDFCFLPTIESKISMYIYNYALDGISFEFQPDTYFKTAFKPLSLERLDANTPIDFLRSSFIFYPQNIQTNGEAVHRYE